MLHVFRRREAFSRSRSRPGRSSGSGGCSSACSGLLGPLVVVFVASELRVSRISPYVCPKRISPLPTLIKLRLSPTFPSSSSQKASQPRTARSPIVISYLSFFLPYKTEASDHVVDKILILNSALVPTLVSSCVHSFPLPFSLSSNLCVRAAEPVEKKATRNSRRSCLTQSPPPLSSLPGQIWGRLWGAPRPSSLLSFQCRPATARYAELPKFGHIHCSPPFDTDNTASSLPPLPVRTRSTLLTLAHPSSRPPWRPLDLITCRLSNCQRMPGHLPTRHLLIRLGRNITLLVYPQIG